MGGTASVDPFVPRLYRVARTRRELSDTMTLDIASIDGSRPAFTPGQFNMLYLPGIGEAAAEWLAAQKVILVGADTWAVEVIPGEEESIAFPVHKTLITDNGIHIVENVRTDLIAAEAAKTGRATFFLNMTVPKAVGLTGTFVNIEAIQ